MKKLFRIVAITFVIGIIIVAGSNWLVSAQSDSTYNSSATIPNNKVGLVLGCKRYLNGGYENPFFANRMIAAAELYRAQKIQYIIVSGDNHQPGYDEPTDMKQALIEAGIPAEKIICDYAGFTTLDSVARAKQVFQQSSVTIISQQFHNERAIYFAKHCGIDAVGYNASAVQMKWALKTYIREAASRVKAVWDVNVGHRQPKFLGNPIPIGPTPVTVTI